MATYVRPLLYADYENGNCDFCKQRNVKVKPLNCRRHFYCRTCCDFSPKFQRKDFQCRTCSERCRQLTDENIQKVDSFLNTETGGTKNEEGAVSICGGNVLTFGNENLNETDDYSDLTGNNDEWEHLLQTMSTAEKQTPAKPTGKKKKKKEQRLRIIPREMSFIKLILPSAQSTFNEETTSSVPDHKNEKIENYKEKLILNEQLFPPARETSSEMVNKHNLIAISESQQSKDTYEEERCTSPVKSPRKLKKPAWGWVKDNSRFADDEDNIELLKDIEGPELSSDDVRSLSAEEKDSFWDF